MSSSATVFEDPVDQLIDTLVSSLDSGLPTGAFRQVADDTLLVTTGALERLARLVDAPPSRGGWGGRAPLPPDPRHRIVGGAEGLP